MKVITSFFKEESGATAIEYGLIAALISIAAIVTITLVGTKLDSTFRIVAKNLK